MPGKVVIVLEAQDREALARIKEFGRGVEDTVGKLKAANPALEGTRVKVTQLTSSKVDAFKASQQWSGVLQVLPGQLGSVASQAAGLASALTGPGGMVAGITAVVSGGLLLAKSLGDDIERLTNLSRQTGLAVSSLEAFEQAAREAGEAPDTLIQGLGKVNAAINDVLMGAPNAGKAFQAIGVDLRQLVKEGASTEAILEATARALAAIPDPTARAAAQMELFGTRGRAMSTVLDTIAKEGLAQYVQAMREAGIVTSEETIRAAKAIDAMADRFDRAMTGMVKKAKASAADIVIAIGEAFGLLPSTPFPIPGSALGDTAPARERPPPQDRVLAPTAEETRAAEDAEKRAQAAASAIAQIFADLAADLADQVLLPPASLDQFDELNEAAKQAEASFRDFTISLMEAKGEMENNNVAIDVATGHLQEFGERGDALIPIVHGIREALEGVPPSILAVRDAGDETWLREQREIAETQRLIDEGVDAIFRMRDALGPPTLSAIERFGAGFTAAAERGKEAFGTLEAQGALTAQSLGVAFEESFFALFKGNLDDLDDIWKAFLDALLSQIAAFLASETVQALLNLGKEFTKGFTSGGEDSDIWDDLLRGLGIGQSPRTTALEQRRRDDELAQRRREDVLTLEEARNAGGRTGRAVGGAAGGIVGGGLGGAGLGPPGAILGGIGGRALGGMLGEWLGDLIGDFMGLKGKGPEQLGFPTEDLNRLQKNVDDFARTTNDATRATQTATNAMDQVAPTQTDLAVETEDLTSVTNDLTGTTTALGQAQTDATAAVGETAEVTGAFGEAVTGLGDAMGEAVGAAEEAAAAAAGSAEAAAASASSAASSAASASHGTHTGPTGGPGDFPSETPGPGTGSSDPGSGGSTGGNPDFGGGGMAEGGFFTRPRRALIAEAGPEAVVGNPKTQQFARDLARAIGENLGGGGATVVNLNVDGRRFAQFVVGGGGRPAGAVVAR